jgi:glycerol-3-phosphate acyltransferase PlsY
MNKMDLLQNVQNLKGEDKMAAYIIVAIVAYLLGSISFSVIISKKLAGFDVREKGSGNAGATNMLRSVGKKGAILTLLGDALKGVVAVLFAVLVGAIAKNSDKALLVQIAGILVVVGHTFPIFFEFKGGKGVATALGVLLMTNWKIGLICLVFALIIMILTRMVSMGSVGAAILFPVLILFIHTNFTVSEGSSYLVYSIILALIVAFNHRSNIQRILNGTENKISFKK